MNSSIQRYHNQRKEAVTELEALVKTAAERTLTKEENDSITDIEASIKRIDSTIEGIKNLPTQFFNTNNRKMTNEYLDNERDNDPMISFQIKKTVPFDHNRPLVDYAFRNYDVNEDLQTAINKFGAGEILKAHLTGRTNHPTIDKALSHAVTKAANGSALTTEAFGAALWELGLSKSHLAAAGLQTFIMEQGTVRFPQITEYPQVQWLSELTQQSQKDVTISSVDGTAKTLRSWTGISAELMQDGVGVGAAINRAFAASMGNEIDRSLLIGNGIEEPKGILNYDNVSEYITSGDLTDFDPILDTIEEMLKNDASVPTHSIMSPATWIKIQKLKTATEESPLQPPPALVGHQFMETSKLPNTMIFMGNFSSLYLGIRLNVTLVQSPIVSDTFSYNLLSAFRGDSFAAREADFGLLQYLTT
jgi:HK97 family phage major capsid protein